MLFALQAEVAAAADLQRGSAPPPQPQDPAARRLLEDDEPDVIVLSSGVDESAPGSEAGSSTPTRVGQGHDDTVPAAERRDGKRKRIESPPIALLPPPHLRGVEGAAAQGGRRGQEGSSARGAAEAASPADDRDGTGRDYWERYFRNGALVTAKFEYNKRDDDEISFAAGDKFVVLGHDGIFVGWLHVQALPIPWSGRKGKAPADGSGAEKGLVPITLLEPTHTAKWDYEAQTSDEHSFREGDSLVVLGPEQEGWVWAYLLPAEQPPIRKIVPQIYLLPQACAQHDACLEEDACGHDAGGPGSHAAHGRKKGASSRGAKRPNPCPLSGGGRQKGGKRYAGGGAGASGPSAAPAAPAASTASAAPAAPAAAGQMSHRASASRADNLAPSEPVCVLCQGGSKKKGEGGASGDSGDNYGALLGPLQMGIKEVWVHAMCYTFASNILPKPPLDVEKSDVNVELLRTQVRQASQQVCEVCKGSGAAIACSSCLSHRNPVYYHLACADKEGLVEWHWWKNCGQAVVHCPQHADPKCEVWWPKQEMEQSPPGWYQCAVVDGPKEGLITIQYADGSGIEDVNLHAVKIRFQHKVGPEFTRFQVAPYVGLF
jgi:hypothetical protein